MSTQRSERIPTITLGWRMKIALGDMKRDEMADQLGVNPATVSRWTADRGAPPKRAYIMQWAIATGVSLAWLERGEDDTAPTPPDGTTGGRDKLAALTDAKRSRTRTTSRHRTTDQYVSAA